jgi:hypothetical protein
LSVERSPRLRGATLAVIAVLALIVVARQAPAPSERARKLPLPPLPQIEATCGIAGDRARVEAHTAETAALGAIERYPFDPRAGLYALSRLRQAERCFLDTGDAGSAARVSDRARSWRARIEGDYRDHGTRYRLALASGRTPQALVELDFLIGLLAQHGRALADHLQRERDALNAQSAASKESQ